MTSATFFIVCRFPMAGRKKKLAEPPPASEAVMPLYLPLTMRLNPLWCFVFLMQRYKECENNSRIFLTKNGQFFTLVSFRISFHKFQ